MHCISQAVITDKDVVLPLIRGNIELNGLTGTPGGSKNLGGRCALLYFFHTPKLLSRLSILLSVWLISACSVVLS
jgi:hypothetical protein